MEVKTINKAAYRREKPEGMTLSELKLYYALALIYGLHHLKAITAEEGKAYKKEVVKAYYTELEALQKPQIPIPSVAYDGTKPGKSDTLKRADKT